MSPLHHHFELGGWPETKVTARFWLASLLSASSASLVVARTMNAPITSGRFDRTNACSSSASDAAGARASTCCAARRPRSTRPTKSRAEKLGDGARRTRRVRRAVRRAGRRWREILPQRHGRRCSRPASRSTANSCGACKPRGVPVFSEVEVAYRICKAPIVARDRDEGQDDDDGADRRDLRARAGKTTHVGGNIGNALIDETAIAEPERLGHRRGVVVPARVDPLVQAAHLAASSTSRPIISTAIIRWTSTPKRSFASSPIRGRATRSSATSTTAIVARCAGRGQRTASRRARSGSRTSRTATTTLYVRDEQTIVYAPPTGDPRPVEIMRVDEIPLRGRAQRRERHGARSSSGSRPGSTATRSRAAVRDVPSRCRHRLEHGRRTRRRALRRRFEGDQSRLGHRGAALVRPADRADRRRQGRRAPISPRWRKVVVVAHEGRRADRRSAPTRSRRRQARHASSAPVRWTKRSRGARALADAGRRRAALAGLRVVRHVRARPKRAASVRRGGRAASSMRASVARRAAAVMRARARAGARACREPADPARDGRGARRDRPRDGLQRVERDGVRDVSRHGLLPQTPVVWLVVGWLRRVRRVPRRLPQAAPARAARSSASRVAAARRHARAARRHLRPAARGAGSAFVPLSFQPSEFAKLALVLFLAAKLSTLGEGVRSLVRGRRPAAASSTLLIAVPVFIEPDMGTASLLVFTAFAMLFGAGCAVEHLVRGRARDAAGASRSRSARARTSARASSLSSTRGKIRRTPASTSCSRCSRSAAAASSASGSAPRARSSSTCPKQYTDFIFADRRRRAGPARRARRARALRRSSRIARSRIAHRAPDRFGFFWSCGCTVLIVIQASSTSASSRRRGRSPAFRCRSSRSAALADRQSLVAVALIVERRRVTGARAARVSRLCVASPAAEPAATSTRRSRSTTRCAANATRRAYESRFFGGTATGSKRDSSRGRMPLDVRPERAAAAPPLARRLLRTLLRNLARHRRRRVRALARIPAGRGRRDRRLRRAFRSSSRARCCARCRLARACGSRCSRSTRARASRIGCWRRSSTKSGRRTPTSATLVRRARPS